MNPTVRSDADRVPTILLSGHLDGDVVRYSDSRVLAVDAVQRRPPQPRLSGLDEGRQIASARRTVGVFRRETGTIVCS